MGERQELPVARIHARRPGERLAQAGFAASEKAARAGRAVGRGSLVFGKVLAALALPALMIGLAGVSTSRYGSEPTPPIRIPTVRFDDAHLKALLRPDYTQFRYTPPKLQVPYMTYERSGALLSLQPPRAVPAPIRPAHEGVHRPTW